MEVSTKENALEKVRILDKKTNNLLAQEIVSLPYFANPEIPEIFSHYTNFVAYNLREKLNAAGLYSVKNNTLYLDSEFIVLDTMMHEKIHMSSASLKEGKIGYQDNRTPETFRFSNFLNESATEWLKCKVLYGENFLENANTQCIISYQSGVIQFQKYVNRYGEERMLKHFFRHDFRSFWNSFSNEEKSNLLIDFETARKQEISLNKQNLSVSKK